MQKQRKFPARLLLPAIILIFLVLISACASIGPAFGNGLGAAEPEAALADITVPGVPEEAVPLFVENCSACHGSQGQGTEIAPPLNSGELRSRLDDQAIYATIANGRPGTAMPVWGNRLSDGQIRALVALIRNWDRMDAAQLANMESQAENCVTGHGMHPGMGPMMGPMMSHDCNSGMRGPWWWPFGR